MSGKELASQCRRYKRHGFDPWAGRAHGGRYGNPLQYSCLENRMDRGAWQATSIGSQIVGHDWSDLAHKDFTHTFSDNKIGEKTGMPPICTWPGKNGRKFCDGTIINRLKRQHQIWECYLKDKQKKRYWIHS